MAVLWSFFGGGSEQDLLDQDSLSRFSLFLLSCPVCRPWQEPIYISTVQNLDIFKRREIKNTFV